MNASTKKNIIVFLFLSSFFFLRIVDVHAFSHISSDEDQTHCELCEVIQQQQEFKLILDKSCDDLKLNIISKNRYDLINETYETFYFSSTLPENTYNKPPPFLTLI